MDSESLSSVISSMSSSVAANNPGVSGFEIIIQILLEIIAVLVQIVKGEAPGVDWGAAIAQPIVNSMVTYSK